MRFEIRRLHDEFRYTNLIELPGGAQLRATAPLGVRVAVGAKVGVHLPPSACRALPQ